MKSLFICLLFVLNSACAQMPLQERISRSVEPQINTTLKGTIIAIHEQGQTKYLTYGEKFDEHTLFEIGSITKTFTGLLFAIAVEKKIINLDTTIEDILPQNKTHRSGKIKLLDLTTHRSGLPRLPCNFYNDRYVMNTPYLHFSEHDLLEALKDQAFDSDPKCQLKPAPTDTIDYSNFGSALLGYLLAEKNQTTYPALLKQWILKPLDMKNTFIDVPQELKSKIAQGYNQKLEPTVLWGRNIMIGAGAIYSTASDLMKYSMAQLNPASTSIAKAITMTQEIQYERVLEKYTARIGMNWFITPGGSIWHTGMTGGFSSLLKVYLKNKNVVLALTNSEANIQCLIEVYEDIECIPNPI